MKRKNSDGISFFWTERPLPKALIAIRLRPWWRFLPGVKGYLNRIEEMLNRPGVSAILTPGPNPSPDGFPWNGLRIPAVPLAEWDARNQQAMHEIVDLLRAAHDELVECRRRGDAKPYEGTAEVHSDGEPPIAYVIHRIERMIRRDR